MRVQKAVVPRKGRAQGQTSPGSRTNDHAWDRHTHNGCTEGLEGMGPTRVEVGGIETL